MKKLLLIKSIVSTRRADKMSDESIKKLQEKRLKSLVNYARLNSPFYKGLYSNVSDDFTLSDLPVTNKITMMSRFDDFLTDQSISMAKIESFTSNIDNLGHMLDNKYLVFKTSGSTGNPAVVLYDDEMISVSSAVAAVRTFAREEDYKKFMKQGKKTAGVFADNGFYLACGMSKYLQLQMPSKKNKINVDVNLPSEEIVSMLNDFQPAMLSGYPSNISLLAELDDLKISPSVVITGGELLTNKVREKLKNKFGCCVQTHYSCTEAGEIACECCEGYLHVNDDWVIVEPVDKNNKPVDIGVMSDKVLITNLANYIQPFIRYELTDRVILNDKPCKCGRRSCRIKIEGRTDDTIIFNGKIKIAPMSFYKILEEIPGVKRFQLVQRTNSLLELRLTAENKQEAFKNAESEILSFLSGKGIESVQIKLSEEEPHADKVSGKFKLILKESI